MAFNVSYIYEAVDKFSAPVARMKQSLGGLNNQIGSTGKRIKALGKSMSVQLTAPIAAVEFAAVRSFGNLEEGLTNVFTLLSSADRAQMQQPLTAAANAALDMGFSIDDATKSLFDSVSALGANKQAIDAYEAAQRLAIGGVTTMSVSLDGITSIMNAYGKETTSATDVATAFFAAQRGGKTTVEALATNIGRLAPVAKMAGVDFKELLSMTAQLTLGGLSTEEATTALRGAIAGLIRPTGEAAKILKMAGVPVGATELRAKGLRFALERLAKVAKVAPDAIAQMIPDIRALTAVSSLGEEQLKSFDSILSGVSDDIRNSTGLNEAYTMQMKTFNKATSKLGGSLTMLGVTFGSVLAPGISFVADVLKTAATWLTGFITAHPVIAKTVGVLATMLAVAGPLLVIIGAIAIAAGLISLPMLAVGAAIVGVTAAIVAAIEYWDDLVAAFNDAGDWVKNMLGFGGDVNIAANQQMNGAVDVNVNVAGPPGAIENVASKANGPAIGNLGVNMAGAGG